jgi:hypothetical protein
LLPRRFEVDAEFVVDPQPDALQATDPREPNIRNRWMVTVTILPGYPGGHYTVYLDELGNVITSHGGA